MPGERLVLAIGLDAFYRSDGSIFQTVRDFTLQLSKLGKIGEPVVSGEYVFPEGVCVRAGDVLLPIERIGYSIPNSHSSEQIIIESGGTPRILIKSEDGTIDKLITDEDLARVRFGDDGEVHVAEASGPRIRRP